MIKPRNAREHRLGQSLVETALVLPLLLLMFMGTVDAGRLLFAYIALEEAVQEGATYAAQDPTNTSEIRDRVRDSSNHAEVTGASVPNAVCTPATVTVSATSPIPLLTPLGSVLFGGTFTLGATVVATNFQESC